MGAGTSLHELCSHSTMTSNELQQCDALMAHNAGLCEHVTLRSLAELAVS